MKFFLKISISFYVKIIKADYDKSSLINVNILLKYKNVFIEHCST